MNDLTPVNPLTNGKIVATNYDPARYVEDGSERGKPGLVMSRSQLVQFNTCPSRWREGYQEKDESNEALRWGSLVDCLLLQPEQFDARYVVRPETYPAKDGEKPWHNGASFCKEWNDKFGEGVTILSADELSDATKAVKKLRADERIRVILQHSHRQVCVTAEYHDEATGICVPIKCLIDIVPQQHVPFFGRCLIDLKTARSAHPRAWQRAVFDHAYHTQAAIYQDAYRSATNEDRTDFLHIVHENFAPYEIGKRLLSAEYVQLGRDTYWSALRRYAQCLKTGVWPGYDDEQRSIEGWTITEPEQWMIQ